MAVDSSKAWQQWGVNDPGKSPLQNLLSSSTGSSSSIFSAASADSWKKLWQGEEDSVDLEGQPLGDGEQNELGETEEVSYWKSFQGKIGESAGAKNIENIRQWNKRFKGFVIMMLLSILFFVLSFVFIPMILIRPSKFALSFTLGSMFFMAAFANLKGPAAYFRGLIQPKYILFSLAYIMSLGFTLYSCLVLGSYILVISSSILQLIALSWFAFSSLPGGTKGLQAMGKMFMKTTKMMVKSCIRLVSTGR